MSVISPFEWDQFLQNYPDAHILQTSSWGALKAKYGWKPVYIQSGNSGAQILFRSLLFGFSIGYIPKGPVGFPDKEFIEEIIDLCQSEKAIVLYIEPDNIEAKFDSQYLLNSGFEKSKLSIQPRRTIAVSLEGNEAGWLGKMKPKTRYNIKIAQKKEIIVELTNDIKIFNHLMKITSERDQFGVHGDMYYQDVYQIFSSNKSCELLIAKYNETPLAALMLFFRGKRAWYFYGASSDAERNRMPTYLLQMEAMRLAAKRGCKEYDLWGIPDFDDHFLENNFISKNDGLWGVYRFKRGFGGAIVRSAGVFQKCIHPVLFNLYQLAYKFRKSSLA